MALFETSFTLPCPQNQVFDFLARPANRVKLVPPEMGLSIVQAPEKFELGSRLEFKIQAFGQVLNFLHEIVSFEAHSRICEKQLKGFFGRWVQDDTLATDANDETQVSVRIEFEPPTGLLGLLVPRSKILEYLEQGFEHRQETMRKLLVANA
ncbi:MAG: SRPBCC family protein [Planctomycetaceae bacterium]